MLVWLATVEMQRHLVGLLSLIFVLTDPYFPSLVFFLDFISNTVLVDLGAVMDALHPGHRSSLSLGLGSEGIILLKVTAAVVAFSYCHPQCEPQDRLFRRQQTAAGQKVAVF